MVSAVILLFTVSTLAAHAVAIPTKELSVQHACKGQTLCDVKPDDYPQEMVDHLVKQNLHHLNRRKREIDMPFDVPSDSNNCVNYTKTRTFYSRYANLNEFPDVIVQSEFFSQHLTEVHCHYENGACGSLSDWEYTCQTFQTDVTLVVLTKAGELRNETVKIPTDCVCGEPNSINVHN